MTDPKKERPESPADTEDAALLGIAEKIIKMRLQVPALFFLEIHKPLTTLAHTGSLFLQPLLSPVFGAERIESLNNVLAERKNIDNLIRLIESREFRDDEEGKRVAGDCQKGQEGALRW